MAKRKNNVGKSDSISATVGYEAQLWQMADALRGNMDAAEYNDRHPDLKAAFILANPPFSVSDRDDKRWRYGVRQSGNLADSPTVRPAPTRMPAVAFTEG